MDRFHGPYMAQPNEFYCDGRGMQSGWLTLLYTDEMLDIIVLLRCHLCCEPSSTLRDNCNHGWMSSMQL